jgi:hypothetical protein
MRTLGTLTLLAVIFLGAQTGQAIEIRGQYLEARTCDVYTGPCFANGEMGLVGKEAVLAWKVDEGGWNDVNLEGLGVALVLKAERTLSNDGIFPMDAGTINSVILVDENASQTQQQALVEFVRHTAADFTKNVQRIDRVALALENDHHSVEGVFTAGDIAEIRTRKLDGNDCICTNEEIYYQPLTDVHYATPAYSLEQSFTGEGLNCRWSNKGTRSAFLAIFKE